MLKKYLQNSKIGNWGLLIILLGSLSWSLTMVKSGLHSQYGVGFWGPNGHDGIWHIALAESLARGSWQMPVFPGENIKNYHIGFDLLLAILHKITLIPISNLYFQILPPVFALLIGLFVYFFVTELTKSKLSAYCSLFFVYFGGGFGWLVTLFRENKIYGESLFWSQQSISTLVNPPFALSLVVIFAGLYILQKGLKTNNNKLLTLSSLLFGLLIQIKVYAGLLILAGLLVAGIRQIFNKEGISVFKVFIGSLIISVLIFAPFMGNASTSIKFQPFWFLESMMQLTDRVGWLRFGEAMMNYKSGHVWLKYLASYGFAFVIFLLGNYSTRILGFRLKKNGLFDLILLTGIVLGIIIPTFFVQSGTPWNTIQFLYYSLVFAGVWAGIEVAKLINKYLITIVVFLTLPTTLGTLWFDYLPGRPPAKVANEELEALNFLYKQPEGVVLTYPFDRHKAKEAEANPPRPLYLYESTAYVSAFSNKPVFLEDEVNLDITGYEWRARRKMVEDWYKESDEETARNYLKSNNIKYIYWIKGEDDSKSQRALLGESQLGLTRIFENYQAVVYKTLN